MWYEALRSTNLGCKRDSCHGQSTLLVTLHFDSGRHDIDHCSAHLPKQGAHVVKEVHLVCMQKG